jgi:hypothetical protein
MSTPIPPPSIAIDAHTKRTIASSIGTNQRGRRAVLISGGTMLLAVVVIVLAVIIVYLIYRMVRINTQVNKLHQEIQTISNKPELDEDTVREFVSTQIHNCIEELEVDDENNNDQEFPYHQREFQQSTHCYDESAGEIDPRKQHDSVHENTPAHDNDVYLNEDFNSLNMLNHIMSMGTMSPMTMFSSGPLLIPNAVQMVVTAPPSEEDINGGMEEERFEEVFSDIDDEDPKVEDEEETDPKVEDEEETDSKVEEETDPKVEEETDSKVEEETDPKVEEETDPKVEEETDPKVEEETDPKVEEENHGIGDDTKGDNDKSIQELHSEVSATTVRGRSLRRSSRRKRTLI